jgi:hypothetical protein
MNLACRNTRVLMSGRLGYLLLSRGGFAVR